MVDPRVVVVGAGPAGVRAAEVLATTGLRPTVVDEAPRSGGQIYRRQPENFTRPAHSLYGTEASKAQSVHAVFDALGGRIDYRPETVAWSVAAGQLHVEAGTTKAAIPFDALIIASGATDRAMPVPGWTSPGVYSLGAAQIALKAQGCSIGRNVVFMGTGPLLYLVAFQYLKAGATVAAVLDTSATATLLGALPALMARFDNVVKGASYLRELRRRGVPTLKGITPIEICRGDRDGVASVRCLLADGRRLEIACDAVGLGYHLRAETQLADLAQCAFKFDAASRQWLPEIDGDGRTSSKGIYLAGDGARILGADGAEIRGRLAAYAVLRDFGYVVSDDVVGPLRRALRRHERFSQGLTQAFPWPSKLAESLPDDTVVCRCETIRAGELRTLARQKGAWEVNRSKAFSRVGMGRCQGRYCGHAAAEILASAAGIPIEDVGRLRSQAPVKPISIATGEGLPQ
jgi:NADPH-dependent 2,4-dienoyl-CoA reductase/sulfur reductase-like enzyme